jgi:hypothetical protein
MSRTNTAISVSFSTSFSEDPLTGLVTHLSMLSSPRLGRLVLHGALLAIPCLLFNAAPQGPELEKHPRV